MAIFKAGEENDLDYVAVRDGGVLLYRKLNYIEEDIQWLRERNYRIYEFDCAAWTSEMALHENLRSALSFPDYYGNNFDALDEVITEVDVPESGGIALALPNYDAFANATNTASAGTRVNPAEIVLSILSGASHEHLLTGKRFLTMVQSNDPTMRYENLGCKAALWNWREWLLKNRGL